jgi:hypothetical protein
VDYEGKKISNASKLETRAKFLQEAISLTLRQGDTYCKYSDKDCTSERTLLSDEQLDDVVGGAQAVRRPTWLHKV